MSVSLLLKVRSVRLAWFLFCFSCCCFTSVSPALGTVHWIGLLVAQSCATLSNPMDYIAHQAPLSMGFSRPEYWNGLPFSSPGDFPKPGIEPSSLALHEFFTRWVTREASYWMFLGCNPPNPLWEDTMPFHRCRNWGLGKINHLPKSYVTKILINMKML